MNEKKLTERELAIAASAQETKRRMRALGMTGCAISEELKARAFPVSSEGYVSKALNGKLLTSGAAELLNEINAILNARGGAIATEVEEVPTETTNPPETLANTPQTAKEAPSPEPQEPETDQPKEKHPAPTHSFRVRDAKLIGIEAAIVLNALRGLALRNKAAGLTCKGRPVAFMTDDDVARVMPYISRDKAAEALSALVHRGVIVKVKDCQFEAAAYMVEVV